MLKKYFLFCLMLIFAIPSISDAFTRVANLYAYAVQNQFDDREYMTQLEDWEAEKRDHYRVVFDNYGRVVAASDVIRGKVFRSFRYSYTGLSNFYRQYTIHDPEGNQVGLVRLKRDLGGDRLDRKVYDSNNKLTATSVYENWEGYPGIENHFKRIDYNKKGVRTKVIENYFNDYGIIIRRKKINSESDYSIDTIDNLTGKATQTDFYKNNQHVDRFIYEYDANGDQTRQERYNPANGMARYVIIEYKNGLVDRKLERNLEFQYKYAANDILESISYTKDKKFICRFVYIGDAEGKIKDTVAFDKNGVKLAEYPGRMVQYISDDGSAMDGHKTVILAPFPGSK